MFWDEFRQTKNDRAFAQIFARTWKVGDGTEQRRVHWDTDQRRVHTSITHKVFVGISLLAPVIPADTKHQADVNANDEYIEPIEASGWSGIGQDAFPFLQAVLNGLDDFNDGSKLNKCRAEQTEQMPCRNVTGILIREARCNFTM